MTMSVENPWTKHRQKPWRNKALDKSAPIPQWLRISFLAYGSHKLNGHAVFQPGDLGRILGINDRNNLQSEIRKAVKYGYLSQESCAECLVVPPHWIEGGICGSPHTPCPVHSRKVAVKRKSPPISPSLPREAPSFPSFQTQ